MRRTTIIAALAIGLGLGAMPLAAQAQGIARGAQDGAATGSRAAGPIGGAVGGVVGGADGGAVGGVKGVLGIPQRSAAATGIGRIGPATATIATTDGGTRSLRRAAR